MNIYSNSKYSEYLLLPDTYTHTLRFDRIFRFYCELVIYPPGWFFYNTSHVFLPSLADMQASILPRGFSLFTLYPERWYESDEKGFVYFTVPLFFDNIDFIECHIEKYKNRKKQKKIRTNQSYTYTYIHIHIYIVIIYVIILYCMYI